MVKIFKKLALIFALVGVIAACFAGCAGSGEQDAAASTNGGGQGEQQVAGAAGYQFTYNGTTISLNDNMADILAKLGDPVEYFESESCAYQGMDKVYTYNSFIIYTYPDNDADYVLSISLKDDIVSTAEGISIGSDREAVTSAYGEGEDTGVSLIYTKGNTKLTFIFENDKVTSIEYAAV